MATAGGSIERYDQAEKAVEDLSNAGFYSNRLAQYSRIDSEFLYDSAHRAYYTGVFNGGLDGWFNGWFDGSDHTLIDNAFSTQGVENSATRGRPLGGNR